MKRFFLLTPFSLLIYIPPFKGPFTPSESENFI